MSLITKGFGTNKIITKGLSGSDTSSSVLIISAETSYGDVVSKEGGKG